MNPGNIGIKDSDNDSKITPSSATNYAEIPKEAYTFWGEETPVDASYYEGRYYALSKGAPAGHWECVDRQVVFSKDYEYSDGELSVKVVPKETDDEYDYDDGVFYYEGSGGQSRMSAFAMFISSSYNAGEMCNPSVCFEYDKRSSSAPGKMYGATYFANVEPGDDIFGHNITVREYFTPEHGKRGYLQMRGYGDKTKNSHNTAQKSDGGMEVSSNPAANFPCFVAEGDRIWVVVDVIDGETWKVGFRKLVEFAWVLDSDKPAVGMGPVEEETHDETDPEWIRNEYPGRWDLTDVRFVNSAKLKGEKDGASVNVYRYGADGQNMSFDFEAPGQKNSVLYPFERPYSLFGSCFYPGDHYYDALRLYPSTTDNQKNELMSCLYALCDVENIDSPSDLKIVPKYYFSTGYPHQGVKSFSPYPQNETMKWTENIKTAELSFEGSFPEGDSDGDKIYFVIGAADTVTGGCYLYNICEYTYSKGPFTVWDYNPPMY